MSKIDQLHARPATLALTTRADARYLATLVRFWHAQGELPRSMSELIRLSLESFAEFLILNNKIDFVQKHSDAMEILEATGLKIDRVNTRNLAKALMAEGATVDTMLTAPTIDSSHRRTVVENPISTSNPELSAAQAKLDKALEEDIQKRIADENDRTEQFKQHLLNPEGGPTNES